jgi:hypothetical protein
MKWMLIAATLAACAALTFGALAVRTAPGEAGLVAADDHSGVGGALSYRARAVTPAPGVRLAIGQAFAQAHHASPAAPRRLREATHRNLLWALATFALADGTVVSERFTRRAGESWHDLGATSTACPAVPPEVRNAWRLPVCQTS